MMLLSLTLAAVQLPPPPVMMIGIGGQSCARSLTPSTTYEGFAWVMGYFSGLNQAAKAGVGSSTDGEGIMGEIKIICDGEPSLSLIAAAFRVYERMRVEKR